MTGPCERCGIAEATDGPLCSWCADGGEIELRKCGNRRCGKRFMVHVKGGSRVNCSFACKKRSAAQRRYDRARVRMFAPLTGEAKHPRPLKFIAAALPKCALCVHGRKSNLSEYGWECQKSAILCRPFGPASLFEKRP